MEMGMTIQPTPQRERRDFNVSFAPLHDSPMIVLCAPRRVRVTQTLTKRWGIPQLGSASYETL